MIKSKKIKIKKNQSLCRWQSFERFNSIFWEQIEIWINNFTQISSSFLIASLLISSSLVHPATLLRKRISAASRRVMSLFVVTHVSLTKPDSPNTPSITNLEEEETLDAPRNDGMRRCRNRSNELIHGGRWWWWWIILQYKENNTFLSLSLHREFCSLFNPYPANVENMVSS